MTPKDCKKLLEMGILQAYAEGKEIEIYNGIKWTKWKYGYSFDSSPENYRIKPEPTFEVGDLVKTSSGKTIYEVSKVKDNGCLHVISIHDRYPNHFHASDLTKVREVRTPFTFEEAVKACAEHGFNVRYNDCEEIVTEVDYNSIRCSSGYLYFHHECLQTIFTSDNTPFCNISYEPITD